MARIRTVKPELFSHEGLHDAEKETGLPLRLAFIGLLTVADREGRFKWRPRTIKLDVLPHDEDIDFEQVLDALAVWGFIRRYEIDGKPYGVIPSFLDHQTINSREAQSTIPAPDSDMHMHAHATHMHAQGEGKGKEGKGREGKGKEGKEIDAADVLQVFEHWQSVMDTPRSKLDDKRTKIIGDALALGYTPTDLCAAIDGCKSSDWHMGANDRNTPFNGLDLILRNAEKIDSFVAMTLPRPVVTRRLTVAEERAATIAALTGKSSPSGPDPFTIEAQP